MGDDERSNQPSDIDIWERLLLEQTDLFKKTTETNKVLQSRVQELERELSVWKLALKTADDEKDGLRKEVSRLQRNIGSFTEDNPLILCLVDGDGNIFAPNLIAAGRAGGRHAAMLITQGITEHIATLDNDGSSGRAQIWLTIYCNKKGLSETLTSNNVCTAEQFDEFFMGFNQANPLFSLVDAGVGKEAADSKIKEYLRVFTRFPQTSRVFFGGGHDNGYTSTLNQLQNEGLHNKITILRGYKDLAFELKSLGLPHLEIEGVFMTNKLQNSVKKASPAAAQNIENVMKKVNNATEGDAAANSNMRQREINMNPSNGSYGAPGQAGGIRMLNPNLKLHQHKPPPCNFFYLTSCAHGDRCRYAHNYVLNPERLEELRANSRKWPCPYVNNGKLCPFGEDYCCMAHRCPHGPKCLYAKQNKCKFAPSMHGNVLPIVESSDGRRSPSPDEESFSPSQSTPSYTLLSLSPTPSPRKKGKGPKASGSGSNSSTKHSTPRHTPGPLQY